MCVSISVSSVVGVWMAYQLPPMVKMSNTAKMNMLVAGLIVLSSKFCMLLDFKNVFFFKK